jgi:hypothetical protein
LDSERYQSVLEICKNYKAWQGMEITRKECILILIDTAIGKGKQIVDWYTG